MSGRTALNRTDGLKYDSGSIILITNFTVFDVGSYTSVLLGSGDDWMDWSVTIYANISLGSEGELTTLK